MQFGDAPPTTSGVVPDQGGWQRVDLASAGAAATDAVLSRLGSSLNGLSDTEAARRLAVIGPNAIRSHGAHPAGILLRQLANPLLILLGAATLIAFFFGERTDAIIITAILALSIGLGFFNEYRSERALAEPPPVDNLGCAGDRPARSNACLASGPNGGRESMRR
jgi:Mg2+-importing ATPase